MKKTVFIFTAVLIVFSLSACAKKENPAAEMQEPMTMDSLAAVSSQVPATTPSAPAAPELQAPAGEQLASLPPSGNFKPSNQDIQTALKNAGYYTGVIDGKIGPMTKKAVEEFQKAQGLKVDGKIGPKTWEALSPYISGQAGSAEVKQ